MYSICQIPFVFKSTPMFVDVEIETYKKDVENGHPDCKVEHLKEKDIINDKFIYLFFEVTPLKNKVAERLIR